MNTNFSKYMKMSKYARKAGGPFGFILTVFSLGFATCAFIVSLLNKKK